MPRKKNPNLPPPELRTPKPTAMRESGGNRNGGKLRTGNPGGKGSPGRPPNALRELLRGSFAERIKILEKIADNPKMSTENRIRAIDMLAKYGLGTPTTALGADGGDPPPTEIAVRFIQPGQAMPADDLRQLAAGDDDLEPLGAGGVDDYGAGDPPA